MEAGLLRIAGHISQGPLADSKAIALKRFKKCKTKGSYLIIKNSSKFLSFTIVEVSSMPTVNPLNLNNNSE